MPSKFGSATAVSGESKFGSAGVVDDEEENQRLSFSQRFGKRLFERQKVAEEIIQASAEGEQTTAEGMLQLVGKVGVAGVFDFLGEGIVSLGRAASAITPDPLEERIVRSAKKTGEIFLNTTAGQLGLQAAQSGLESYGEFAKSHPRAARNIEAVVDIALLAAPVSKAIPAAPGRFSRTAAGLEERAAAQTIDVRGSFVDDLLTPKQTQKVRQEQTTRTTESGILRKKVVAPSRAQAEVSSEVQRIAGVSSAKTLQGNLNSIVEVRTKLAENLKSSLESAGVPITREESIGALDAARASLAGEATVTGSAATTGERLIDNATKFIKANPETSAGLLQARKDFDTFLKAQKRNVLGDAPLENALTIAAASVRDSMNQLIIRKNPSAGVRASLDRQSRLFRAEEALGPKAADEASNIVARFLQNVTRVVGAKTRFTQAMATIVGVGGLGAASMFAGPFLKIATVVGVGYVGGRIIIAPATKKALASILRGSESLINKATNPELVRQLRLDRAAVVQLLRQTEEN